ncbi:MAG: hypothetical protein RBT33_00725 [Candidatus Dojkabacteria bacterium]|jgi:hypothetical protein|nr:hypothetical protein [Candidatus Dojkabacteria bacterium]
MIHYVTLGNKGSIMHRGADGKKYIDDKLPQPNVKWKNTENVSKVNNISELPNDRPIAVHLGLSGLIAIDFDDELFNSAIQLNEELNEEYRCTFITKSVGKIGGHFLYKYEENLLTQYINNPNGKKLAKLDSLYGNTMLYMPNKANHTKEIVKISNELITMPIAMQQLVINRYASQGLRETNVKNIQSVQGTKLALIAKQALTSDMHLETLLHIITPKRYKTIMENSRKPLIPYHPDRLPDTESGHMYLVALSGVLMVDESIDATTHKEVILYLNSLFGSPVEEARVKALVNRDVQSESYNYNPEWMKTSFIVTNKDSHPVEIFMFTYNRQINYLAFNHVTSKTESFSSAGGIIDYISSVAKLKVIKEKLTKSSLHITIINRPDKPFGLNYSDKTFNTYVWSDEQAIFYNPKDYNAIWDDSIKDSVYNEEHPYFPKVTLAALKHAIGDKLHTLFLPFMKRKLLTRDHSPLFFVLYGVPHSFKSAIVNGVFSKLTKGRHKMLEVDIICDKYNDWQLDTDIVLIDEVHHLSTFDRVKMIRKINEITGNKSIAGVRRMHASVDSAVYNQEITFFLTTNAQVALTTEVRDRRMVVFKALSTVASKLNMTNAAIEKAIINESKYFAYYLATEVEMLNGDDYITNYLWQDDNYRMFQENAQSMEDKIAKAIDDKMHEQFFHLLQEAGVPDHIVAKSLHKPMKKPGYSIRLLNSNDSVASCPGIFNNTSLDINKLRKLLSLIEHLSYGATDYELGTSIRTGSKKVEWDIQPGGVPDKLIDIMDNEFKSNDEIEM